MLKLLKREIGKVLLAIALLVLFLIESSVRGDFTIFLEASQDLLDGEDIYANKYHEHYHYYYDVLFALVVSLFKFLPTYWAQFFWLLLNLFFTIRIWKVIQKYIPVALLSKRQKRFFTIASFTMIFALWHKNIHLSQMTIFILFLSMEGIHQIKSQRFILGGLLIAVGISIKIMPIVLLPYLLYRSHFKAVALTLAFLALILFSPGWYIGVGYNMELLESRWALINPTNQEHVLDVSERSFHSVTTWLSTLLVEHAGNDYSLDLRRHIANVSLDTLRNVILIVRLILVALTLLFLRSKPCQVAESKLQAFYELSYILLVTPLLFPHQQHYAFFFAFPAIAYLTFYFTMKYGSSDSALSRGKKIGLIAACLAIYFLLNNHFILGQYRRFYDHYKTLTYGILILIPILAYAHPKSIEIFTPKNRA